MKAVKTVRDCGGVQCSDSPSEGVTVLLAMTTNRSLQRLVKMGKKKARTVRWVSEFCTEHSAVAGTEDRLAGPIPPASRSWKSRRDRNRSWKRARAQRPGRPGRRRRGRSTIPRMGTCGERGTVPATYREAKSRWSGSNGSELCPEVALQTRPWWCRRSSRCPRRMGNQNLAGGDIHSDSRIRLSPDALVEEKEEAGNLRAAQKKSPQKL